MVVLGEHGGALVDGVDDALGGPRHVELGVLELAGELLDQALAERGDVGGVLREQLERGRVAIGERGAARTALTTKAWA